MGNTDVVNVLVTNHADLNIEDNFGKTALNEGKSYYCIILIKTKSIIHLLKFLMKLIFTDIQT